MIDLKDNSRVITISLSILVFISFVYSFFTGEDSLGKAEHDYIQNNIFLLSFSENFNLAIQKYGTYGDEVRNLPTFNIIFAQFIKLGIEISNLKYLNLLVLILLISYFLKSLEIKYKNLSFNSKILFSCIILLSPTIRSLVNFTYPFLWALCFFIISIFYYLNFRNNETNKLKNALYCILHLVIASYITPNFSVFIIIFLFQFFKEFKLSKSFFQICFFSFILSLPALFFLILKDFYIFKNDVYAITYLKKFNISNYIYIPGWVNRQEMNNYLNSADIYISNSYTDGSSVSLLEAMACGLSPIVTRIESIEEWVKDDYNGYLVDIENPDQMMYKILELTNDPSGLVRTCVYGALGHLEVKEGAQELHKGIFDSNLEHKSPSRIKDNFTLKYNVSNIEFSKKNTKTLLPYIKRNQKGYADY